MRSPSKLVETLHAGHAVFKVGVENFPDLVDGGLEELCAAREVGLGVASSRGRERI